MLLIVCSRLEWCFFALCIFIILLLISFQPPLPQGTNESMVAPAGKLYITCTVEEARRELWTIFAVGTTAPSHVEVAEESLPGTAGIVQPEPALKGTVTENEDADEPFRALAEDVDEPVVAQSFVSSPTNTMVSFVDKQHVIAPATEKEPVPISIGKTMSAVFAKGWSVPLVGEMDVVPEIAAAESAGSLASAADHVTTITADIEQPVASTAHDVGPILDANTTEDTTYTMLVAKGACDSITNKAAARVSVEEELIEAKMAKADDEYVIVEPPTVSAKGNKVFQAPSNAPSNSLLETGSALNVDGPVAAVVAAATEPVSDVIEAVTQQLLTGVLTKDDMTEAKKMFSTDQPSPSTEKKESAPKVLKVSKVHVEDRAMDNPPVSLEDETFSVGVAKLSPSPVVFEEAPTIEVVTPDVLDLVTEGEEKAGIVTQNSLSELAMIQVTFTIMNIVCIK